MPDGHDRPAIPPPEELDHAIDWLQRNLDALTDATRRRGGQAGVPSASPSVQGDAGAQTSAPAPPSTPPSTSSSTSLASTPASVPSTSTSPSPSTSTVAAPGGARPTAGPRASPSDPPAAAGDPPSDTPLLDRLGRDLTRMARDGQLGPVIGRTTEIDWLVEVLVRSSKRNPILLGPAGAGKTAIVEGLAQRIAAGHVPALLQGTRLVEVPLASLVAGTEYRGQLEERLAQLVREASRPGIILFFDEIHLLAGAGQSQGGMGADEVLKPALSRGDIAVVGATTPEEYRATIEKDAALARRFTTISISELDRDATRPILRAVRDTLARSRGVVASDAALDVLLEFADRRIGNRRFPDKAIDLLEQAIASALVARRTRVSSADARRATETWEARSTSTPTIERFGRDLVGLARDGRLGPIVGREREIDLVVETLMRRTRRNPLLLGPAGSGKTAIVEGLAIRIAAGAVPEPLRGLRLFDVALLPLAASVADDDGVLTDFLVEARHPSVGVFFDEIHQLAAPTVHDLAQALKPALSRGEIACVGATTGEEYQASIEPDPALARRFTLIPVSPMDRAAVMDVLRTVRDRLAGDRGLHVDDAVLNEVMALADDFLPNRAFPDKGVDVLEQAIAHAVVRREDAVTVAGVRDAVEGLIGQPLDPGPRLDALAGELRDSGLLPAAATEDLLRRLGVSLRGLDTNRSRPDAVVLLCADAAASADALEAMLARHVFGRDAARIELDLAAMADASSLSTLIGSAPGLVGSDRPVALADLRRDPRQVVGLRGIDRAAPVIRDVIGGGLTAGRIADAMGRTLPLEAAIVVISSPSVTSDLAAVTLGPLLLAACDAVADTTGEPATRSDGWTRDALLDPLAERFRRRGIELTFDDAFASWIELQAPPGLASADAFLDRDVVPALVAALPADADHVTATLADGRPTLTVTPANETPPKPAPGTGAELPVADERP
jgi:ATP-dependent Clp protease ATP-binding subunit ClpC